MGTVIPAQAGIHELAMVIGRSNLVIPEQAGIHKLAMVVGRSNLVIPAQAGIHSAKLECGIWNGNLKTCNLQYCRRRCAATLQKIVRATAPSFTSCGSSRNAKR